MTLFSVTMKANRSAKKKDRLSRTIHAASVAAGYPEDDLFQRFLSLDPSDLRVDPYYPALPKPRWDQMLTIEVLVSSGTDTGRKRSLVAALVEKLGEAGVDPNDIMVFFLETDRASGSFGGGQFAPPCCLTLINVADDAVRFELRLERRLSAGDRNHRCSQWIEY